MSTDLMEPYIRRGKVKFFNANIGWGYFIAGKEVYRFSITEFQSTPTRSPGNGEIVDGIFQENRLILVRGLA